VKLLVATRSAGKQREIAALLADSGFELLFPVEAGLSRAPEEASLEVHGTFDANARAKAEYFAKRAHLATLAEDSGLEVFSLGGDPGVRSRRFAGASGPAGHIDQANNAQLLQRLLGAPPARRRARYRCALAFVARPGAIPEVYQGACTGEILTQPRGAAGFGYDPLFQSDDLGKTFAEATLEEKAAVSHRARAFEAFLRAHTVAS